MVFVFDLMIFVVNFAFVIVCIVWFDVWLLALCVDGHFMLLHTIHILNPKNRTQHPLLHVDSLKLEC